MANIQELLNDPDVSLETILLIDSVTYLFNQSMPSLIQFFVFHAEDLLNTAICSPNKIVQTRAFNIVHSDNSILLQALLHRKIITKVAEEYLFDDDSDFLIISRLVHIIEMCVCDYFDDSVNQFYFISELARFLDNPAVIEFFSDCLNHPIFGKQFIQWLNDLDFDQRLMDTVEDQNRNMENGKINADFAMGLYQVLDICLNSPLILVRFLSPSRLSVIIQPLDERMPPYVRNVHAKLILDICNEYTVPFIASYVDSFLRVISFNGSYDNSTSGNDDQKFLSPLYISSYQILCLIYRISPDQCTSLSPIALLDVAFKILTEYQEHSIALTVASQFIVKCAKINAHLRDEVMLRFIPVAEFILENNISVTMRAFCSKIMQDLEAEVNWEGYDKSQFNYMFSFYLSPINDIIEHGYGGPVPEPAPLII